MHILIVNGPNINMLGIREPEIYGHETYQDLCNYITKHAAAEQIQVEFFQSNHEGALIDAIQQARGVFDGIVINPAAYTHTSIGLLDAIKAVDVPTVEVHLSDPDTREEFRKISYVREGCIATIKGKGFEGYTEALRALKVHLRRFSKDFRKPATEPIHLYKVQKKDSD